MLPDLPEEIIELILSFAPDFRDNLKNCQMEILDIIKFTSRLEVLYPIT